MTVRFAMHPTKLSKQELEKLQAALEQLVAGVTLDATHALVRHHRLPKQALAALLKMTTSAAESHLQTFFLTSPAPHPSAADRLLVQQAMGSASIFCDKAQIEHWFKKATARFFAILERTCAALTSRERGRSERRDKTSKGKLELQIVLPVLRYEVSGLQSTSDRYHTSDFGFGAASCTERIGLHQINITILKS